MVHTRGKVLQILPSSVGVSLLPHSLADERLADLKRHPPSLATLAAASSQRPLEISHHSSSGKSWPRGLGAGLHQWRRPRRGYFDPRPFQAHCLCRGGGAVPTGPWVFARASASACRKALQTTPGAPGLCSVVCFVPRPTPRVPIWQLGGQGELVRFGPTAPVQGQP